MSAVKQIPKQRRIELSLDNKVKLIKQSESLPKLGLIDEFSIGKSTVLDILKCKQNYKDNYKRNHDKKKCHHSIRNLTNLNTPLNRTFLLVPSVFGLVRFTVYRFLSLSIWRNRLPIKGWLSDHLKMTLKTGFPSTSTVSHICMKHECVYVISSVPQLLLRYLLSGHLDHLSGILSMEWGLEDS